MPLGAMIAQGREAEVFEWADGEVLKLYRPGNSGHVAEAAALRTLERAGGPASALRDAVDVDGRAGLVLERLDGGDMLALLERKPWRLWQLARLLAETHELIHAVEAPAELPEVKDVLGSRIEAAVEDAKLRAFALGVLEPLPTGDRLCHGDFHPGNVLVGERVGVIDWSNASRGVPEADFARTMLLLTTGDPPPGMSRPMRALVATGRSMFARAYARRYRRSPQLEWRVVQAAARLAEGIEAEVRPIIAFLKSAAEKT